MLSAWSVCWGRATCPHPQVWSSPTSPTALQQFPRSLWEDGPRSLLTLASWSSAVALMTTRPALLVTTALRCWPLPIQRRRPRSSQRSLQTAAWPWWQSSACSSRTCNISNRCVVSCCFFVDLYSFSFIQVQSVTFVWFDHFESNSAILKRQVIPS